MFFRILNFATRGSSSSGEHMELALEWRFPTRRERERLKGHRSTTSRMEQGGMGRSKQGGGSIGKDHRTPS